MIPMVPIVNGHRMQLKLAALVLCSTLCSCTSPDLYDGPTDTTTVRYGDTVDSLASLYGLTAYDLIALNNLKAPYTLTPGQPFRIPHRTYAGSTGPTYTSSTPYGKGYTGLKSFTRSYPPSDAPTQKHHAVPQAQQTPIQVPTPKPISKPAPTGPKLDFAWPMKGALVSEFGEKPEGLKNDGINIAGKVGTPIRSAYEGTVAYADNKLKGFGHLVIIKHTHGWSTAYAHASKLFVQKGQKVKKGQTIALCGEEGNVKSPQLHFEIRHNGHPVNPSSYLN